MNNTNTTKQYIEVDTIFRLITQLRNKWIEQHKDKANFNTPMLQYTEGGYTALDELYNELYNQVFVNEI